MEELIARIAAAADVEPEIAQKAAGMIFAFLRQEGPQSAVDALFEAVPGAAEAAGAMSGQSGGDAFNGLSGAMGGGLMGLADGLTGLGLDMDKMRAIGRQVSAYVREKAGDEAVDQVAAAISELRPLM